MALQRRRPSRRSIGPVRSEQSQSAILDAAAHILRKVGFDGVTVEAVARKARASKPTIYKWWGTKTHLIFDAYMLSTPVVETSPDSGDLYDDLASYFDSLWKIWSDQGSANTSLGLLSESLGEPKLLAAYRDEYLPRREAPLRDILVRGIARGELPAGIDMDFLVDLLCAFHFIRLIKGKSMNSETIRKQLDTVFNGLRNGTRAK